MDLKEKFKLIGIDKDYSKMNFDGLQKDVQGWASTHPIFKQVFSSCKPELVIEVGTWKGASVIHMASIAQSLGLDTKFICVDTWLGSSEAIWVNPELRKSLMLQSGYPSMFRQFIFNILSAGIMDDIYPLPMTSSSAARLLRRLGVQSDAIYIDAGHGETEVLADLNVYYELLRPGGVMFGDDYLAAWPGVVKAVNRFSADKALLLTTGASKWSFAKPLK